MGYGGGSTRSRGVLFGRGSSPTVWAKRAVSRRTSDRPAKALDFHPQVHRDRGLHPARRSSSPRTAPPSDNFKDGSMSWKAKGKP